MWLGEGKPQVWVYELERGTLTPLTSEGQSFFPIWSPDGRHLVFTSMRSGDTVNLFWKSADGSGSAERLTTSEYPQQPYSWSPDGKVLSFIRAVIPGSFLTSGCFLCETVSPGRQGCFSTRLPAK